MDDQALIRTYGNTDLPEGKEDRPLVTFALLAYNQEDYIREAVEGAFSQTYSPLEIILSDDLSSDATFPIMKEMAAAYDGPHRVFARQTAENVGTLRHVMEVAEAASGEMLVLSAGDDISRPERVAKLQAERAASGSWAVFSGFSEIDDAGRTTCEANTTWAAARSSSKIRTLMAGEYKDFSIIQGAVAAYNRALFERVQLPSDGYILSEDTALSLLIHVLGKDVSYIPEPLVDYRSHPASLSNAPRRRLDRTAIEKAEDGIARMARSMANTYTFALEAHSRYATEGSPRLELEKIERERDNERAKANWWKWGLIRKCLAISQMNLETAKWALPRLIPKRLFLEMKYRLQ